MFSIGYYSETEDNKLLERTRLRLAVGARISLGRASLAGFAHHGVGQKGREFIEGDFSGHVASVLNHLGGYFPEFA
jgi:hypothetical protein